MKNTIVSSILLSGVIALLMLNSQFINRNACEMLMQADRLEQENDLAQKQTAWNEINSIWQKSRKMFALSVPYHKIRIIDSHLARVSIFSHQSDSGEYKAAVYALKEALSALRDDEKLSLHNII